MSDHLNFIHLFQYFSTRVLLFNCLIFINYVTYFRYGDCFRTNIFGNTQVFFSSKEAAKIILSNEGENFTKKYMKSIAELVGNHSVLCAPPEHHKMIRTRLANLFSTSSLSNFIKQFDELILQSLPTWEKKGTVVVLREALAVNLLLIDIIN